MWYFSKTARNFFMILSLGKVENISFHMNLVSQLAALVCQPGVHRNKERRKQLIGRNLVISLYDILLDDIFLKTALNFFTIYSLPKIDNISFHLNLVSQLAALVCTIGVHGNIGNSKQSFIAIYRQVHAWEDYLRCYISPKRLEIFIILSLRQVNNISFTWT